jgi:hypothetical protein
MATERQIAANQRNARQSTGPRSGPGKRRSSRNAYRHGLSASINSSSGSAKQLNKLARKIAGRTDDPILIDHARAAAQAEVDLAHVRRVKVALIESVLGDLQFLNPSTPILLELQKLDRYERRASARRERALRQITDRKIGQKVK